MQAKCPKCERMLTGADINVTTDVARCSSCNELFPLSALVHTSDAGPVDLNEPPPGAWYRPDFEEFVVGASTRHPVAFFLVPFLCLWSGLSLGGIYGTQILQGELNPIMCLFGLPFVFGTIVLGSLVLMTIWGKVVVRVSGSEGEIFTGIGVLGLRRRFDWQQVRCVRTERSLQQNGRPVTAITLDCPKAIRFGIGLTDARREYIANVLRHELLNGQKSHRF
jgi:hypothetical protein